MDALSFNKKPERICGKLKLQIVLGDVSNLLRLPWRSETTNLIVEDNSVLKTEKQSRAMKNVAFWN